MNNSPLLSGIRSSPVDHMSHEILRNAIQSPEDRLQPIAPESLVNLLYGYIHMYRNIHWHSLSLSFLVIVILSLLIQYE